MKEATKQINLQINLSLKGTLKQNKEDYMAFFPDLKIYGKGKTEKEAIASLEKNLKQYLETFSFSSINVLIYLILGFIFLFFLIGLNGGF